MVTTAKEARDTATIVEDELRRLSAPNVRGETRGFSSSVIALGVIEIIFGLLAAALPFITSAFFTLLLGAILLVSGALQTVNAVAHGSWGRFFIGLVSAGAGALAIAHPLYGLAFLTLLLGVYLVATGATRLFVPGGTGWDIAGGVAGILLGGIVLAGWPAASIFSLGLIIGINLLFGGIATVSMGSRLRGAPRETH